VSQPLVNPLSTDVSRVEVPLHPGFRLRLRCPRLPQEHEAPKAIDFRRRGWHRSSASRPVLRQKVQHRLIKGVRVLPRRTVSRLRNRRLCRVRQ
jgi:hypothetical protein